MSKAQKNILFFSLFISTFYFFISSSGINCSNDGSHTALALSLKNEQSTSVMAYTDRISLSPDYAIKDSVIYSDRLPGNAFLIYTVLVYADVFESLLIDNFEDKIDYQISSAMLLPCICGALAMLVIFMVFFRVFKLSFTTSILLMLVGGLCTLNAMESIHLFSHAPSILLITFALFYCLDKKENLQRRNLYLLVAVISFASLIELQNILFFGPITLYFLSFGPSSNSYKTVLNKKNIILSLLIMIFFILCLIAYNYCAFQEIMVKSNKYNPFFPEEKSFFTSLSGNPIIGLDELFTSFINFKSNFNWSKGIKNATPGLLASNPIYILSIIGLISLFKNKRKDALLLISFIMISVLIAAFHKTTLVRHVASIYLILFIPIAYYIKPFNNDRSTKTNLSLFIFIGLSVYSFFKTMYLTNNYHGRDFSLFEFPNIDNSLLFFVMLSPILLLWIIYILTDFKFKSK